MGRAQRVAALLLLLSRAAAAFWDTESWVGSAYTPAGTGNSLWWANFSRWEPAVRREIELANKQLGITTIRVFLHSLVFENSPDQLELDVDRFLGIADASGVGVGFVFFDDCWAHAGASLGEACVPRPGVHNGCWMASPQDIDRTDVERYEPYVAKIVSKFRNDSRVRWWEIYNEPKKDAYSLALRDAGYRWATALSPSQPVLSCWDDNNNTQVVDHHDYGTAFSTTWASAIYSNPGKGALITEGGSRWYQPPYSSDQGSPLTVIHFLEALQRDAARPYVPGAMLCWTLFVSNDNTRWHWNSKEGSPEPLVPWDGLLWPDGTPVSFTEAAAMRRYTTGRDDFVFFADFLADGVVDGDTYLTLSPNQPWLAGGEPTADVVAEATFWLESADARFEMSVRQQPGTNGTSYVVAVRQNRLTLSRGAAELGAFDLGTLESGGCIPGAWSILRVHAVGARLRVYVNPTFSETGYRGDDSDASRTPRSPPPRIDVTDTAGTPLPAGGVVLSTDTEGTRVDYFSIMRPTAYM